MTSRLEKLHQQLALTEQMDKMKLVIQNAKKCQDLYSTLPPEIKQALSRIDHRKLYFPFFAKLVKTIQIVHAKGKSFWVTQGMRTVEEQNALYAQGRTKPGGIVTKVIGGHSCHNYGIAADAVYDKSKEPGLQPSWQKEDLIHFADAALETGLDAGFYWKNFFDGPHVQLDIRKYGITARNQLLTTYKQTGQSGVIAFLDQYNWT